MTFSNLLTTSVTIIPRSRADGDDDFSDPTPTEGTEVTVLGALQQRSRDEPNGQGDLSDTDWLLILPAGTAIDRTDAVRVDGRGYEVIGEPWSVTDHRTGATHHLEVSLNRTGNDEGGS